jgi:hypothetical protein
LPPTWTPTVTVTPRPRATPIIVETFTLVPPITSIPQYTQTTSQDDPWKNFIALPSPSGEWIAYYNFIEIKVVNTTKGKIWTLPGELFERCQYILPVKWSHKGDTLFFGASSYLGEAPQPTTISFFSTAGKINVKTGKWERLFPDPVGFFDFSLSSDDTYIAYTQSVQDKQSSPLSTMLTVLNLKNHRQKSYTVGTGFGGNIVWLPYKGRFMFQVLDLSKGSSIIYYDADLNVLRYLVKEKKAFFSIQSWLDDNRVLIQETDWKNQNPALWYLDPFTNEFSAVPTIVATP